MQLHDTAFEVRCGFHLPLGNCNPTVEGLVHRQLRLGKVFEREHAVAFKSMLRRKGVRVVSITEHADDTPTGKLLEGIIESVDELYSPIGRNAG